MQEQDEAFRLKHSKPLLNLGVKEVSKNKAPPVTVFIKEAPRSLHNNKRVVVMCVKNLYASGAAVAKNWRSPYALAMAWSEESTCHQCQVHSRIQFQRQQYALMNLAEQLKKNFKNEVKFFQWKDEMDGTVFIDKYYCPENKVWYLNVTGDCNALYDVASDALLPDIGHIETEGTYKVKVMLAANGCALSSKESLLLRARDEGLKVESNTFDPHGPLDV